MFTKCLCITLITTVFVQANPIELASRIERTAYYDQGYSTDFNLYNEIQYDLNGNPIIVNDNNGEDGNVGENVIENVGESVGENVGENVGESVGENVGENVGESVGESVGENVGENVSENVGENVGEHGGEHGGESVNESVSVGKIGDENASENGGENRVGNGGQYGGENGGENRVGNGGHYGGEHGSGSEIRPPIGEEPNRSISGFFHKLSTSVKNAVDEGVNKVHSKFGSGKSAFDAMKSKFHIDKILGKK